MYNPTPILILTCIALAAAPASSLAQSRPSIADLQAQIATMQAALATDTVPGLASYLSVDATNPAQPAVRVSGANLHVVNGLGATATINGVGNLIIGYDRPRPAGSGDDFFTCSRRWQRFQAGCLGTGGVWALNHKTGSHNLIVGDDHNYAVWGSILSGYRNHAGADGTVLMGGSFNWAAGDQDSIFGGSSNVVEGYNSVVAGGFSNRMLLGSYSGIYGGSDNTVYSHYSVVLGGYGNLSQGHTTTITGGLNNDATGNFATVSGGANRSAFGHLDWVAGGLFQDF